MAKFGIALEWGSRGRWFESSHSDHLEMRGKDLKRWFQVFSYAQKFQVSTSLALPAPPKKWNLRGMGSFLRNRGCSWFRCREMQLHFLNINVSRSLVNLIKDDSSLTEEKTAYTRNPLTHVDFLLVPGFCHIHRPFRLFHNRKREKSSLWPKEHGSGAAS